MDYEVKDFLDFINSKVNWSIFCPDSFGNRISSFQELKEKDAQAKESQKLFNQRSKQFDYVEAVSGSGLIVWALSELGIDFRQHSENGLWQIVQEIAWEDAKETDLVFRFGDINRPQRATHVGVIDVDGKIIEAKDRKSGVVKLSIAEHGKAYWHRVGRLPYFYACPQDMPERTKQTQIGEHVTKLQLWLLQRDYDALERFGVSGIHGEDMEEALVKLYDSQIFESAIRTKEKDKGELVKLWQRYLLDIDADALPHFGVDGIHGKETEYSSQLLYDLTEPRGFIKPPLRRVIRYNKNNPVFGNDVLALQKRLNALQNSDLVEDGIYGKNTHSAVFEFKSQNGIDQYADVGQKTWDLLFA